MKIFIGLFAFLLVTQTCFAQWTKEKEEILTKEIQQYRKTWTNDDTALLLNDGSPPGIESIVIINDSGAKTTKVFYVITDDSILIPYIITNESVLINGIDVMERHGIKIEKDYDTYSTNDKKYIDKPSFEEFLRSLSYVFKKSESKSKADVDGQ